MIDKTQTPPHYRCIVSDDNESLGFSTVFCDAVDHEGKPLSENDTYPAASIAACWAHAEAVSRPAVVDFAERWLEYIRQDSEFNSRMRDEYKAARKAFWDEACAKKDPGRWTDQQYMSEAAWSTFQFLAAARGERTLP